MKSISFIILLLCSLHAFGQKKQKYQPDTVYYLADTAETPVKDRILDITNEAYSKSGRLDTVQVFRIKCNCLPHGYYPTFTRHLSRERRSMTSKELEGIKFTSLSDLLNMVLKDYENDFYHKHVVIIVEAIKNEYFSGEVFLTHYSAPVQ